MKRPVRLLRAVVVSLAAPFVLTLLACATTATAGLLDSPLAEQPADTQGQGDGTQEDGLEIVSRPEGARVYLDNRYVGLTPLFLPDLPQGRYKLTVRKNGYYTASQWIEYPGGAMVHSLRLEMITGFLKVEALPASAQVRVGSEELPAGRLHELPVGSHVVRVRAFGYQEQSQTVRVQEREVTTLAVSLRPAAFELSGLRAAPEAFNPRNAGLLGQVRVRFQVTSFGTGTLRVLDRAGREVYASQLSPFRTWEQSLRWDGRDSTGQPLPDGEYRLRVTAAAENGLERAESDLALRIDSSILLTYRSLWSGSAGMLYCPTPEVLAGGSLQLSTFVLGRGGDGETLVPIDLALRLGLGRSRRYELDVLAGVIAGYPADPPVPPVFAAAAFKAPLLRSSAGPLQASTALQAKLAYQNAGADLLADFSGLSLGVPAALQLGAFTLAASPELVVSPWRVYDPGEDPPTGFFTWMYGRLGLIVDLSPFSFALSASLRTLPFQEGWGLDSPFQAALEAHWLIPGTQLFLSLALGAEVQTGADARLSASGGGGLGILR